MMNKVVLVGELIQNVCISQNEHSHINSFIIATTRVPKDNKREHEVHFIYCKAFGKAIPKLLDTLDRGQIICVSGQVATTIHNNSDGTKDYRMEIWTESVKCLPERLSRNDKIRNPSDMINQAVNLYNRYDYIGEKSVLTLMSDQPGEKPDEAKLQKESMFKNVGDEHIEQLKEALESNNSKSSFQKDNLTALDKTDSLKEQNDEKKVKEVLA
jgi:single-strand DNA-binding protein